MARVCYTPPAKTQTPFDNIGTEKHKDAQPIVGLANPTAGQAHKGTITIFRSNYFFTHRTSPNEELANMVQVHQSFLRQTCRPWDCPLDEASNLFFRNQLSGNLYK